MNKTELKDGMVKLTAEHGVKDTRNGKVYSEVVCNDGEALYFVAAE